MACYKPIPAWFAKNRNENGKRELVFNGPKGAPLETGRLEIPCGKCVGCKTQRARAWAIRLLHESKMHHENAFLTLTFNDDNLPTSLAPRDLQLFFKRLRHHSQRKFRYYAVGEYGERLGRPHYHVILFGYDFPDKTYWKGSKYRQYRSKLLETCWPNGNALCGTLTPASAQYVTKYAIKQISGNPADRNKPGVHREFAIMSRNPGIGARWIDKYATSVFPRDFLIVPGGAKTAVPPYYLNRQEAKLRKTIKAARVERNKNNPENEFERREQLNHFHTLRQLQQQQQRDTDALARLRNLR
jgi:hypothetical protein